MYVHNCYVNILVCPQSLWYFLLQEMSLMLLPFRRSCTWWLTLEQRMARGKAGTLRGEHGQTPPKPSDPHQQQHEDKPVSHLPWSEAGRQTRHVRGHLYLHICQLCLNAMDPKGGTFYKTPEQCSSKMSRSWKTRKEHETVTDWRRLTQCISWVGKKNINGKLGEFEGGVQFPSKEEAATYFLYRVNI